jgi:hypothetical protein
MIYAIDIRQLFSINPDFVINMDETPCYHDNAPAKKVVTKGARSVNGAKSRKGDYRATVCLATTQSGMKLPPFVIFKGKPGKTLEKNTNAANGYSPDAKYCFQEKAWNDTGAMLKWKEQVLKPYVEKNPGLSQVILDDYNLALYRTDS